MHLSRNSFAAVAAAACLFAGATARAGEGQSGNCCNHCCPPYMKHCFEGAPKIKFKHGCPKPICDPCNLPHFGYYQTCWSPWPFPPDWSHCRVQPTSTMVPPHPGRPPVAADQGNVLPNEQGPIPRTYNNMSMAKPLSPQ